MQENQPNPLVRLALIAAVVYLAYGYFSKEKVEVARHPAASSVLNQPANTAAAYRKALSELTDKTTEAEFNALLRTYNKAATDLSFRDLDTHLQKTFNPDSDAKTPGVWTPELARKTYEEIATELEKLDSKLSRM